MQEKTALIGVVCLLAMVLSCQIPTASSGALNIQFGPSGERTVVSDWPQSVTSYQITITSQSGFEPMSQTASKPGFVEFRGVQPGTWNISVTALNGSLPVAGGSLSGISVSNQGGTAMVTLTADRQGTGDYQFKIRLPDSIGITSFSGRLYDLSETVATPLQTVSLSLDGMDRIGMIAGTGIPGGIYRLAMTFFRGSVIVGQLSENVNIWSNVLSDQWLAPDGRLHPERTYLAADFADASTFLANLTISGDFPLTPGFSSMTTSYAIAAPSDASITMTPTQAVSGQIIEIQVGTGARIGLSSGTTSAAISSDSGVISLWVTSPDHTSVSQYLVSMVRPGVYYSSSGADSGRSPLDSQTYENGDSVTIQGNSGAMTKQGYSFAGWNTQEDGLGMTLIEGATHTKGPSDLVLYPLWLETRFTFTNALYSPSAFLRITKISSATGELIIPNGVTSIGTSAAWINPNITSVTFPMTLVSIEDAAFYRCINLTAANIPASVVYIGSLAFKECGFTSVTIPSTVLELGPMPFHSDQLSAFVVDDANPNYASIDGAIYNKAGTALFSIPPATSGTYAVANSVTSIGEHAFAGSAINTIVILDSVDQINIRAFFGAEDLNTLTVSAGNATYRSTAGILYDKTGSSLIAVPFGYAGALVIPEGVVKVNDSAAAARKGITSISFPSTLTRIEQFGFANAEGLTSVTIPATLTNLDLGAFLACSQLTSVTFEGHPTMSQNTFTACIVLQVVTLLDSIPPSLPDDSGTFDLDWANLVIRVPAGALDTYRNAQGWSEYADIIEAMVP